MRSKAFFYYPNFIFIGALIYYINIMNYADKVLQLLVADVKRRLFDEGCARIKICLSKLTSQQIWYKHNANVNSVGNLVLHLCGNVRQYVLAGIAGQEDIRERAAEFSEKGPLDTSYLVSILESLEEDVSAVLVSITAMDLIEDRTVQGFDENVISILVHVAEHFSYHVGQITYYTKYVNDVDTGYYAGLDLDVIS